jgi:nucleoside-diphosphate-sugar epimerase
MTQRRLIIGCGYLGRRVARHWTAQGDTVFALTRTPEHAEEFRRSGLTPIVGDVTNAASLAALPEVDTILYAVGLDRGTEHSQRDVYVGGLDNALNQIQGKVRRLIYISSTSVYGQNLGEWVDESSECQPESPNGQVCLDAERLLQQKVPQANILRLAGIYGPGRIVARIEALRAGQIPEGNPDAWLNLIHVDDAVAAVLACKRCGAPGATYLVCDDHPCRRREYYSLLAAMVGAPAPFTSSEQSPSASLNKRCSNRRLRDELQVALRYPRFNVGLPNALTTR